MLVVVFYLFFTLQNIHIKWRANAMKLFGGFFGPEDHRWAIAAPGGAPRGAQPTRAPLGAQARPGGLCPPQWPPAPPLHPINSQIFQKNAAFGLRLIGIFCEVKTKKKTATRTWDYVNRLVPKNDIKLL